MQFSKRGALEKKTESAVLLGRMQIVTVALLTNRSKAAGGHCLSSPTSITHGSRLCVHIFAFRA